MKENDNEEIKENVEAEEIKEVAEKEEKQDKKEEPKVEEKIEDKNNNENTETEEKENNEEDKSQDNDEEKNDENESIDENNNEQEDNEPEKAEETEKEEKEQEIEEETTEPENKEQEKIEETKKEENETIKEEPKVEEKKKSKAWIVVLVIIAIILIPVIIIASIIGIAFGIYFKNAKSSDIKTNTVLSSSITNSVDNSPEKEKGSNEDPYKMGEWGEASKNVTANLSKKYKDVSSIDVPVTVTKVTRGAEAETTAKEYFSKSRIYKYEEPKEGLEWAVVDYKVDLSNVDFEKGTIGTSTYITSGIKGYDGKSLKYNGVSYILTTKDITDEYVKEPKVYDCKFVVQIPKGCSEYLIKLGDSYSGKESYFKGE